MRRRAVRPWTLPLWFALGALLTRAVLAYAAPHYQADLAQPLAVATNWGGYGVAAWCAAAAATAGAGFAYARILADPPRLRITLLLASACTIAGASWSPLLSSDVYAYAAYGEMARLHLDPYVHHALASDPIVAAASWQWSGSLPVCVYGEGFVALARALVVAFAGLGTTAVLQAFRAFACVALLACGAVAYVAADDPQRGRRAAAFITTNPVALYATLEGHNDALMIACVLGGFAIARRAPVAGGMAAALAAAIKAPALAGAAALAFTRRSSAVALGSAAGAAIAIVSSLRLIAALRTTVAPHGTYHTFAAVQALSPLVAAALAIALLLQLRTFAHAVDRWLVLALCAWLAIPNPYAWYALWLLAIAAFARDRRVVATTLAVAYASTLRYLPDAAGPLCAAAAFACALAALLAYLPMAARADA